MIRLFSIVVNMSITASLVILAIIVLRLLLKRTPRIFSYLLWLVVWIRLICPFVPESSLGIVPKLHLMQADSSKESILPKENTVFVPKEEAVADDGFSASIIYAPEDSETEYLYTEPETGIGAGNTGRLLKLLSMVWLLVFFGLVFREIFSYRIFMKRILKMEGNETEETTGRRKITVSITKTVKTPFTVGFLHPVIYLPDGMESGQKELVIEHEKIHIRRMDYLIKPMALVICCIHWFNPFVWAAFYLMECDMETSCDEAVLNKVGYDRKKEYAGALLNFAVKRKWEIGYPIAFGESGVKSRIENVVKLKKTKISVAVFCAVFVCAVTGILLMDSSEKQGVFGAASSGSLTEGLSEGELYDQGISKIQYLPEEADTQRKAENSEAESKAGDGETKQETANSETEPEIHDDTDEDVFIPQQVYTYGTNANVDLTPYTDSEISPNETEYLYEEGKLDADAAEAMYVSPDGGERITNYDPSKDQFVVLLLSDAEKYGDNDNAAGSLYSYPVEYTRISDGFGTRINPITQEEKMHSGIDFAAKKGTPVTAAAGGIVVKTGYDTDCGNYVVIQHENGDMTYYAMCDEIMAEEGSVVERGQQIAAVGTTGKSTGAHLHFAVSRNGEYVEPEFES